MRVLVFLRLARVTRPYPNLGLPDIFVPRWDQMGGQQSAQQSARRLGPAALSRLGLAVCRQLGEADDDVVALAGRQQRVERSRGTYMVGPVRQLRGTGRRLPDLAGVDPEQLRRLLDEIEDRLWRATADALLRARNRYPCLQLQPPVRAGDMLVSNNWGPFDHAMLVVEDARLVDGRWTAQLAQCVVVGCSTSTIVYPRDPEDMRQLSLPWRLFLLGRAYNAVRVVRHRHASPQLIRSVVKAALGWTRGNATIPYHIHLPSVLKPKPCLRCQVSGDAALKAADRYVQMAEGRRDHTDSRQMCSEMAFGAWVAGIVLHAEAEGLDREAIGLRLTSQLPIRSARGCWPRHVWNLPEHLPEVWERVGVALCAAVASGR